MGGSGIVQVKATHTQHMSDATAEEETAYGHLVAPGVVAVNHDHFFAFRLDMDVDGPNNNLMIDRLKKVNVNGDKLNSPRQQIWQVFPEIAEREKDAMLSVNLRKPTMWRVTHADSTNTMGNPVSYRLKPGGTGLSLMDNKEFAQARAGFTEHNLWVTPYNRDEKYAAGTYPNRHPGGAGLPTWTKDNRSLENEDLVLCTQSACITWSGLKIGPSCHRFSISLNYDRLTSSITTQPWDHRSKDCHTLERSERHSSKA